MPAQPLPPTPPLTAAGFADPTWQRWLALLQQRTLESYGPGTPIPMELVSLTRPSMLAAFVEFQKNAIQNGDDATLKSLVITTTLQVDGAGHFLASVAVDVNLTVTGSASIGGDVAVTGNIGAGGNLTVTGASTLEGNVGFSGAAASGPYALPGAATDPATTQTLANACRSALIAKGLGV